VPRELKEKQRCPPLLSFSRRDEEISTTLLGGKRSNNGSNMGEPIRTRKEKVAERGKQAQRTSGSLLCGASQKKGRRKSAHLSSAGKKCLLILMKRNRKRTRKKRTKAKRTFIAGRAHYEGHGRSKSTSKWQWAIITLDAGFPNISLSQQNKFERCWQQWGCRAERTNVKYDW